MKQDVSRNLNSPQVKLDVSQDRLAIIRIEGMHCNNCERSIIRTLSAEAGVHEVEVDFRSGQASVLFDPRQVAVPALMRQIDTAGYRAAGFSLGAQDAGAGENPLGHPADDTTR